MRISQAEELIYAHLDEIGLNIVWPNTFSQITEPPFVEVFFNPNTAERSTLAGGVKHQGILNCIVVVQGGNGSPAAIEIAEKLETKFKFGSSISGVDIYRPPEIKSGYKDGNHWRLPINIYWQIEGD